MKVFEILTENVGNAIEKLFDEAGFPYKRESDHIKVEVPSSDGKTTWHRIKTLAQAQQLLQAIS